MRKKEHLGWLLECLDVVVQGNDPLILNGRKTIPTVKILNFVSVGERTVENQC